MEESLTILIFSSHSASTLALQFYTIDSMIVRMAPDLMVIFVASSSRRIYKLLSSFSFSLDRSSMYLIRFSFCPSLVLRSSRVFQRVASFCWFCCLSSFSLTISLRALSTISAWMALRLVSWLSLNLSMFSLLAISSLWRFLSLADSSVTVSQELTLISSNSFSQSYFSASFSSSCIRSMVWGATPVDSRSSSRSFTHRYISYNRKLLLNIGLSFSFYSLHSPNLLGKLMAGGIENPSNSSLSRSVRTNELQTSLGVDEPEPLGIGGLSLSVDYNFQSLFLIIPRLITCSVDINGSYHWETSESSTPRPRPTDPPQTIQESQQYLEHLKYGKKRHEGRSPISQARPPIQAVMNERRMACLGLIAG